MLFISTHIRAVSAGTISTLLDFTGTLLTDSALFLCKINQKSRVPAFSSLPSDKRYKYTAVAKLQDLSKDHLPCGFEFPHRSLPGEFAQFCGYLESSDLSDENLQIIRDGHWNGFDSTASYQNQIGFYTLMSKLKLMDI
ncbi:hypothetical protein N7490_001442 [Penicillium lividum]|nr:hypothetical protein N7490_001442 [Penicillium lividum]